MFEDIAVNKIKENDLEIECELGQGGFGVVRKMKLHLVGTPCTLYFQVATYVQAGCDVFSYLKYNG